MKVCDIVVHTGTGEVMQIKSISETVATCNYIHRPKIWSMMKQENVYETCVCMLENLKPNAGKEVKPQLNLF